MSIATRPGPASNFNCVIIGGGIGGILLALKLQHEGLSTAVLEKNSFVGGYFAKFQENSYEFDYGVSNYLGLEKDGWLTNFFQDVGLAHLLPSIKKLPAIDYYVFPDFEFELVSDYRVVKRNLSDLFPEEKSSINQFFSTLKDLYVAITDLQRRPESGFSPVLMKHMNMKYSQFIDDSFSNRKLKAILSARVFGSNVNLLTMAAYLGKLLFDGIYRIEKDIASIMKDRFEELGGKIYLNELAKQIEFSRPSSKNNIVTTSSGMQLRGEFIISACDMKATFNTLLKNEAPRRLVEKVTSRPVSLSSLSIFLTLKNLPSSLEGVRAGRVYFFEEYDIPLLYKQKESGKAVVRDGIKINICEMKPQAEGAGKAFCLRVELDTDYEAFNREPNKELLMRDVLAITKQKLKINDEDILHSKIMTPIDFAELTLASQGAASGWSPNHSYNDLAILERSVSDRFYQTGAWDRYGSGILPIFFSVERIYRDITKKLKAENAA